MGVSARYGFNGYCRFGRSLVGKKHSSPDITDRKNMRDRGSALTVGHNKSARAFYSGLFETKTAGVGGYADCDEEVVGSQQLAVGRGREC